MSAVVSPDHLSAGRAWAGVPSQDRGEVFVQRVVVINRAIGRLHYQAGRLGQGGVENGERLEEGAVIPCGLQTGTGELLRNIVTRCPPLWRTCVPPQVRRAGQGLDLGQGRLRAEGGGQRQQVARSSDGTGIVGHRLNYGRSNDMRLLLWLAIGLGRDWRGGGLDLDIGYRVLDIGGSLQTDIPGDQRPCPNQQHSPRTDQGDFGIHPGGDWAYLSPESRQPVIIGCLTPQRLASAIGEGAPDPFHRPKLVTLEPPPAQPDLGPVDRQRQYQAKRGAYFTVQSQAVVVEDQGAHHGL